MRLIDADSIVNELKENYKVFAQRTEFLDGFRCGFIEWAIRIIQSAPTVDNVKHGRWKKHNSIFSVCSCCFYLMDVSCGNKKNYCPCCGAKMDGENNA